jgi:DHA1 family solute carrier family 18 vesicular amine transporter 1/2
MTDSPNPPGFLRLRVAAGLTLFVDGLLYLAIIPLLPYYADRFDLSKVDAAILVAGYPIAFMLTAIPSGYLAGRFGPRRVVIAGLVSFILSSALFAWSPSAGVLLIGRFLQGIAGGVGWSAAISWLTGNAPLERRARAVGVMSGILSAGAVAGPGVGALAGWTSTEFAFGVVVLLGAIALVATLMAPTGSTPPRDPGLHVVAGRLLRNPLVLAGLCFALADAAAIATVDLLATLELGRRGVDTATIGLAIALGAVLGIVAGWAAGRLGDRVGPFALALTGCIGLGAFPMLLIFPLPTWAILAVLVAIGPFFPILMTGVFPMIANASDRLGVAHGTGNALLNVAWAGGFAGVPLAVAPVAERWGDAYAYVIAGALVVLLLSAAVVLRGRDLALQRTAQIPLR